MKEKMTQSQKDFLERSISQNRPKRYTQEMAKGAKIRREEIEKLSKRK